MSEWDTPEMKPVEPVKCIWCSSDNITAKSFDCVEGGKASRFVVCEDCGGDWVEVFTYLEFIEGEPPDNPKNYNPQSEALTVGERNPTLK